MFSFANWFKPLNEPPFHVVLIDLKEAASGQIVCVEKPLTDDLKYVALSYRWGEMHEVSVDTQVGYTALVKSFHMDDFYQLCKMMRQEIDLQHMDYVWVDGICVDQANYERRKATIYRMSDIYHHASYILAVPDLHAEYLKTDNILNRTAMERSATYRSDLYHILRGTYEQECKKNSPEKISYIVQSLSFMEERIKDWSTRVWVISEFNIAKKKNNLKYWFTQLAPDQDYKELQCGDTFTFFDFEFNIQSDSQNDKDSEPVAQPNEDIERNGIQFQKTMFNQLQRQSIFEMLLKSKASRHEDRLYAILPLTDYKSKITDKATVTSWNINTLSSLRLRMFDFMSITDKLNLLFLSSTFAPDDTNNRLPSHTCDILPTFATSSISWDTIGRFDWFDDSGVNWNIGDYCNDCPIELHHNMARDLFYINFCPSQCYVLKRDSQSKYATVFSMESGRNRALCSLQSKEFFVANAFVMIFTHLVDTDDVDAGPQGDNVGAIVLNGNFKKNMWVLANVGAADFVNDEWENDDWELHNIDKDSEGFNIY